MVLAVMAWAGGLAGFLLPPWMVLSLIAAGGLVLAARWRRGRSVVVGLAWLVAATTVAGSAMLRVEGVAGSPLADLAEDRAFVSALVRVTSDPLARQGRYDSFTLTRATTIEVVGRGGTYRGRVPILVIADDTWLHADLGSVVRVEGRAASSDGGDLAAVISTNRPPVVVEPAGDVLDAAAAVRAGIRHAVAGAGTRVRSPGPRRGR